jgi:hypothetical protein
MVLALAINVAYIISVGPVIYLLRMLGEKYTKYTKYIYIGSAVRPNNVLICLHIYFGVYIIV